MSRIGHDVFWKMRDKKLNIIIIIIKLVRLLWWWGEGGEGVRGRVDGQGTPTVRQGTTGGLATPPSQARHVAVVINLLMRTHDVRMPRQYFNQFNSTTCSCLIKNIHSFIYKNIFIKKREPPSCWKLTTIKNN